MIHITSILRFAHFSLSDSRSKWVKVCSKVSLRKTWFPINSPTDFYEWKFLLSHFTLIKHAFSRRPTMCMSCRIAKHWIAKAFDDASPAKLFWLQIMYEQQTAAVVIRLLSLSFYGLVFFIFVENCSMKHVTRTMANTTDNISSLCLQNSKFYDPFSC